jgi:hypothetical protein
MQTGSRSGNPSKMTLCLDRAAPQGGTAITLVSDHANLFPVPGTVSIPPGSGCLSYNVLAGETRVGVPVTVSASLDKVTLTGTTMVRPARPAIYTQTGSRALGFSKVTVCAATGGGAVVPLVSDRPDIFPVPAAVTIPDGRACLSIVVPVGYVSGPAPVTVTATFATGPKSGTTMVRNMGAAPPAPTETATLTVTPDEAATATPTPVIVATDTPAPTETETVVPTSTDTPVS